MTILDKKEILKQVEAQLLEKVSLLKKQISDLALDAQNDAKGSAGDKHETGLAMMHLEQEKLSAHLEQALVQLQNLQKISTDTPHNQVTLGSIVQTQSAVFFVCDALPTLKYQKTTVFPLSTKAPIYNELKGKRAGESFIFNAKQIKIDFII